MRMIEVGDGTGFGQIGFGGFGAIHEFAVRYLDSDEPLQLVIVGEIDEAETALTEDFLDSITTDVRWRSRIGRGSLPSGFVYRLVRIVHTDRPPCIWV